MNRDLWVPFPPEACDWPELAAADVVPILPHQRGSWSTSWQRRHEAGIQRWVSTIAAHEVSGNYGYGGMPARLVLFHFDDMSKQVPTLASTDLSYLLPYFDWRPGSVAVRVQVAGLRFPAAEVGRD